MSESIQSNKAEFTFTDYGQGGDISEEYTFPWITWGIILFCTMLWSYLHLGKDWPLHLEVMHAVAPEGFRIWTGAVWGLVTTAFVHFDIWHILFNMWLAESFGRIFEPNMGRKHYLLFILSAAFVSSGMQLFLSGQPGIGFSGVLYAMFGYALVVRRVYLQYQVIVDKSTSQFLIGWFILCLLLTSFNIMEITNEAHVAGLAFGICVGQLYISRVYVKTSRIVLVGMVAMTILSTTYLPWSDRWRARNATLEIVDLEERAEAGIAEAQYLYSDVLMRCGEGRAEGILWLTKAADQKYLPAMNRLVRILATDQDPAFRNAEQAVEWGLELCEKDRWRNMEYVDTLAAAYAEAERWDVAIALQKRALERLGDENTLATASFQEHLQKYQRHEKVRE
ncbi:MAG: rhomboid family intramembrane serine protease [Candidatus Electrothrix aestuarii]|uniref:Rhomboid family intramembrane serine protease n=1 Tax=Candidatus Electrothrix aestuarii TaxID=3062594 RepID=A0AAU8LQC5_9BACT|nr:rhomboid family intramembrane serine protease [Candidatus Electrothrix aestuarii]WPD24465.1 MAG: rhomboid family intramembrane serine protease [Candidatus Electrothrix sp. GW3-3]